MAAAADENAMDHATFRYPTVGLLEVLPRKMSWQPPAADHTCKAQYKDTQPAMNLCSRCDRYIPVGLLEVLPQKMSWRPPAYLARNHLEGLMASEVSNILACLLFLFLYYIQAHEACMDISKCFGSYEVPARTGVIDPFVV